MDEKWVSEIHKKMEQKTTEELLEVWVQNDRGEWTDEAFEAVSRILGERGEPLPPQQESIDREKERLFQGILPETRVQLVAVLGAALLAAILFVFIEVIPRSIRSSEMEALFGSDRMDTCANMNAFSLPAEMPSQLAGSARSGRLLVLTTGKSQLHTWNDAVPPDRLATSPDDLDIILCVDSLVRNAAKEETLQVCRYISKEGDTSEVSRVRHIIGITAVSAQTRQVIAATTIVGDDPPGCPSSIPYSHSPTLDSWPTEDDFVALLSHWP